MHRFVIIIDNPTPEQQDQIIEYLTEQQMEWVHWFDNTWLVVDRGKNLERQTLGQAILAAIGKTPFFMVEILGDVGWVVQGPQSLVSWVQNIWNPRGRASGQPPGTPDTASMPSTTGTVGQPENDEND